jgi:hypothetical protein
MDDKNEPKKVFYFLNSFQDENSINGPDSLLISEEQNLMNAVKRMYTVHENTNDAFEVLPDKLHKTTCLTNEEVENPFKTVGTTISVKEVVETSEVGLEEILQDISDIQINNLLERMKDFFSKQIPIDQSKVYHLVVNGKSSTILEWKVYDSREKFLKILKKADQKSDFNLNRKRICLGCGRTAEPQVFLSCECRSNFRSKCGCVKCFKLSTLEGFSCEDTIKRHENIEVKKRKKKEDIECSKKKLVNGEVKTIKKNRPRDSKTAQTDRCILPKIGREIKTGEIVHLISNGDFSYLFAPQIEDLQDYEGNFKTPSGNAFEKQYRQCWDAKCKQIVKPNEKFTCKCRSEYHIKCEGCSEYLCSNTLKKHNEGKCPGLKFK